MLRSCTPQGKTRKDVSQIGMMAAGASAGFAFWTVAYPIDIIKTRVQADNINNPRYKRYFINEAIFLSFRIRGYLKELY